MSSKEKHQETTPETGPRPGVEAVLWFEGLVVVLTFFANELTLSCRSRDVMQAYHSIKSLFKSLLIDLFGEKVNDGMIEMYLKESRIIHTEERIDIYRLRRDTFGKEADYRRIAKAMNTEGFDFATSNVALKALHSLFLEMIKDFARMFGLDIAEDATILRIGVSGQMRHFGGILYMIGLRLSKLKPSTYLLRQYQRKADTALLLPDQRDTARASATAAGSGTTEHTDSVNGGTATPSAERALNEAEAIAEKQFSETIDRSGMQDVLPESVPQEPLEPGDTTIPKSEATPTD